MYLLTRVRTANPGRLIEAIEWATATRDYVNANSGLETSAHLGVFGRPVGCLTWAAFVESRAQYIAEGQKLLADPAYQERTRRGADLFLGPPEDHLRQIMHMKGISLADPRPAVSQTWTAQIAHFQFDGALAWSIDVSDYVADLTKTGVVLLADNYGDFGRLAWIAGFDSAEKADAVNETMLADAGWRKMVANAADLFIDGATRVWLNRTLP
jgi:hypothetical protein